MLILSGIAEMFGKAAKEQFVGLATAAVLTTGIAFTPSANAQEIDTSHVTTTHLNEMDTRAQFTSAVSTQLPQEFDASTAKTFTGSRQIQISAPDNSGNMQSSNVLFENGATKSTIVGPGADGQLTRFGLIWEGTPDDPSSMQLAAKLDLKIPEQRAMFSQIVGKLDNDYITPENTLPTDPTANNSGTSGQFRQVASQPQAQPQQNPGQFNMADFYKSYDHANGGLGAVITKDSNNIARVYQGDINNPNNLIRIGEYDLNDMKKANEFSRLEQKYVRIEEGMNARRGSQERRDALRERNDDRREAAQREREAQQDRNQTYRDYKTTQREVNQAGRAVDVLSREMERGNVRVGTVTRTIGEVLDIFGPRR